MILDRNKRQIREGDILLNVSDERSMFDAWAFLICITDKYNGQVIRDFNAWNRGWESRTEDLVIIGHYSNFPEILKAQGIRPEQFIKKFEFEKDQS